jgi:hypothetical protein
MTAAIGFLRLCQVELDGIAIVGSETNPTGYGRAGKYYVPPSGDREARSSSDRSMIEAG